MKRMIPLWKTVEPLPKGTVLTKAKRKLRPLRQPKKLVRLVPELPLVAVVVEGSESLFVGTRFYSITPKGT